MENSNLTKDMLTNAVPIRGTVPGIPGRQKRVCDVTLDENGNYILVFKQQGQNYVTLSLKDFQHQLEQLA